MTRADTSMIESIFCGLLCQFHADASLFLPELASLLIADLHLEKGRAQSGAAPLPGYDTDSTLAKLTAAIERTKPQRVFFLGDSFHTSFHASALHPRYRRQIDRLAGKCQFIWLAGNHDSALPYFLPGQQVRDYRLGPLALSHQVTKETMKSSGWICGHFHPKARLSLRVRRLSGRCFIDDARGMIMPAFGVFAGGLNITDKAIQSLFLEPQRIHFCHAGKIYRYPMNRRIFLTDRLD